MLLLDSNKRHIILSGLMISLAFFAVSCEGLASGLASGRCQSPNDIAADGSRCGDRSSNVRPGGR